MIHEILSGAFAASANTSSSSVISATATPIPKPSFVRKLCPCRHKSSGVRKDSRPIPHIPIQIRIPRRESNRILAEPAAHARVIPPVQIILQAGGRVEHPAGEAEDVLRHGRVEIGRRGVLIRIPEIVIRRVDDTVAVVVAVLPACLVGELVRGPDVVVAGVDVAIQIPVAVNGVNDVLDQDVQVVRAVTIVVRQGNNMCQPLKAFRS